MKGKRDRDFAGKASKLNSEPKHRGIASAATLAVILALAFAFLTPAASSFATAPKSSSKKSVSKPASSQKPHTFKSPYKLSANRSQAVKSSTAATTKRKTASTARSPVASASSAAAKPNYGARTTAAMRLAPLTAPAEGQYRALWADAFHDGFKTPEQTAALVEHARKHNFNTIFIEVRKIGDAYYRSDVEPLASDMAPGYDPLGHIIALAHDTRGGKQRIEVHAWMVVYRVARAGQTWPRTHVLKQHPSWAQQTITGVTREEYNLYLDPGVPSVIDHTAAVACDIARKYDIDGLHLDYIRYPGLDWGYNATAVARFNRQYGRSGRPKTDDSQWSAFRREQVTEMVRRIHTDVKAIKPKVVLSVAAAAMGAPGSEFEECTAFSRLHQDWSSWMRDGLIDALFLMNYRREGDAGQAKSFRSWNTLAASVASGRYVVAGQGSYLQNAAVSLQQLRDALLTPGLAGVAVYSYACPSSRSAECNSFWSGLNNSLFTRPAPPPTPKWIVYPSEGVLSGRVYEKSGRAFDSAVVAINGPSKRMMRSDGSGFFSFIGVPPGRYNLRATLAQGRQFDATAVVIPGKVSIADLRESTATRRLSEVPPAPEAQEI